MDTSNIEPALLIETLDSINNLEEILKIFSFKYVHIGLNDLHIERGTSSMFEPFIDGLMEKITSILKKNNQSFGIGGIGKIGSDLSPTPECVLNEHFRLESKGVILSRSFKGNFNEKIKDHFKKELSKSVKNLRNYEKKAQNLTMNQLAKSHESMKASIEGIIKNGSI